MENHINVKATITVQLTIGGVFKNIGLSQGLDGISDLLLGDAFQIELVSSNYNPNELGAIIGKEAAKGDAKLSITKKEGNEVKYEANVEVHEKYGEIGAIYVTNEHRKETYIKDIVLEGLPQGLVKIHCNSWIHSKYDNPQKRIFFAHKPCLPSETPNGLKSLREKELDNLRGNGEGERKSFDRIYDYAPYNDLVDPDQNPNLGRRPVLGSKNHPYPRRCRTGRPPTKADPLSESGTLLRFYIPRDENFEDVKEITFGITVLDGVLASVIPSLEQNLENLQGFQSFKDILNLYTDGIKLTNMKDQDKMHAMCPNLFQTNGLLQFPRPDLLERDEFAWFRDDEFSRETLAGINPYSIKLVTDWPMVSKLDPKTYGTQESAISSELIEQQINRVMSAHEAVKQKKLFMLDYHDLLLPFVNKVRKIQGTTLYGSRTIFFLTDQGTLRPVAIELTRPPTDDGKPQWKHVYTPSGDDATNTWLWKLAKAHVLAHDSGHHELVSHWLRTHGCTEPYVIATNRQLSAMHPIYMLMKPYFRYTLEINALARKALINAGGIIETSFSPDKYSMEFSSAVYDQEWRFDLQGLPADLITRGMAMEDPSSPHGLKLAIQDYPFANDGLILWEAIKQWVTDYVTHYYPNSSLIKSDNELQSWWQEIIDEGHHEKKDQPWWPKLNTTINLIDILTTMIWVSSAHHAAVNFGQYTFAGYFPNRATIARIKMPNEDPTTEEWNNFLEKPLEYLLKTFPTQIQATKVMAVLNVLSTHSPDEEYIGDQSEPSWETEENIKAAFDRFNARLKELEKVIDERNEDDKLKNRRGAGTAPYQLLKPFSKPGVTDMGVPNSISI